MHLRDELIEKIGKMLDEMAEIDNISYERIQWEVDNFLYPYIGSYLADGSLSREDGKEIFKFCEIKLREIKERLR
jgi:pyruvate-formate lyase